MDGGGEEGQQQPHLVLAHKLFLLSHPDVDDLAKVDLRADVLAAVKSDGNSRSSPLLEPASSCVYGLGFGFDLDGVVCADMASLYESLAADGVLEMDAALLAEMRARIDEEIRKLDEK